MPNIRSGESRDEFIARSMEDEQMRQEFPDEKQRYAVALAKWENKSKRFPSNFEFKSVNEFELSDMDMNKRTAVIAHSVYDVIDRTKDISRKGMFTKTWQESKARGLERSIGFFINHDDQRVPGLVKDVWETENKAYTKVWFGRHTLGNDTMSMMDDGIIRDASFGFIALRKNPKEIKGETIRELKEVYHGETSVVYGIDPVNPFAGVVSVTKADAVAQVKAILENMEKFVRNGKASDETLQSIEAELKAAQYTLQSYDTVDTRPEVVAPSASVNEFADALHLLTLKI